MDKPPMEKALCFRYPPVLFSEYRNDVSEHIVPSGYGAVKRKTLSCFSCLTATEVYCHSGFLQEKE
jgi:hypothetical protein